MEGEREGERVGEREVGREGGREGGERGERGREGGERGREREERDNKNSTMLCLITVWQVIITCGNHVLFFSLQAKIKVLFCEPPRQSIPRGTEINS